MQTWNILLLLPTCQNSWRTLSFAGCEAEAFAVCKHSRTSWDISKRKGFKPLPVISTMHILAYLKTDSKLLLTFLWFFLLAFVSCNAKKKCVWVQRNMNAWTPSRPSAFARTLLGLSTKWQDAKRLPFSPLTTCAVLTYRACMLLLLTIRAF